MIQSHYGTHENKNAASQPSYEALSYTWGSSDSQVVIEIVSPTECEEGKGLSVGPNLYDALKHLRLPTTSRTLWIDAICINQEDILERNQQVACMGGIYQCAQRVVVWLGPESIDSSLALRVLGHIGNQIEFTQDLSSLCAPGYTEKDWWELDSASCIDDTAETWQAIHNLLQCPWFDRLWIFQEIQLANASAVFQCGNDMISWRQLRRAIMACCVTSIPSVSPPLLKTRFGELFYLANDCTCQDPIKLLQFAKYAKCSDPRDRVFALLGLLPAALSQKIRPQYTLSSRDVFVEAFVKYIEYSGKLDILCLTGPSWAPEWSSPKRSAGYYHKYNRSRSAAEAVYIAPDVLMATGVVHDTVEAVVGPLPEDYWQILETVLGLWPTGVSWTELYPTRQSLGEACASALHRGRIGDRWPKVTIVETVHHLKELTARVEASLASDATFGNLHDTLGINVFRTRMGYLGIGALDVRPGDKVSVLLGCPVPAILRQMLGKRHLFIGCAYTHGIMDDEALLGPIPEGCKVSTKRNQDGTTEASFVNSITQEKMSGDPRLGRLSSDWQPIVTKDI